MKPGDPIAQSEGDCASPSGLKLFELTNGTFSWELSDLTGKIVRQVNEFVPLNHLCFSEKLIQSLKKEKGMEK